MPAKLAFFMKVRSRKQAIELGEMFYFTGKPCKHGHVSKRYAKTRICVECSNSHNKSYHEEHKQEINARHREYNSKPHNKERAKELRAKNLDIINARRRAARAENPDAAREERHKYYYLDVDSTRARNRRYYQANRKKILARAKNTRARTQANRAALQAKRRAAIRNQTPENADLNLIEEIYVARMCAQMYTGLPVHVDHKIPISKGGLHHEDNLQLMYGSENQSKGDRLPECVNMEIVGK